MKIDELPDGWTENRFGDVFENIRTKGTADLPTLSVTINSGLVRRDSLDRKMETNLEAAQHVLIQKNDIAYNMMRMWQGASGIAEYSALVSPAYVILRSSGGIDPQYASYLFKLPRTIYLFWAYSYGITNDRLRLYFNDFASIPINLPSVPEQRKIAAVLSTWDQSIEAVEALLSNVQRQKMALMQQLLPRGIQMPRRRLSGYSGEWEVKRLDEIFCFSKGKGLSKGGLSETGKYSCILYGELYTYYSEVVETVRSRTDVDDGRPSKTGDILIPASTTTSGIDLADATALLEDGVRLSGDINILRAIDESQSSQFFAYLLTHGLKREIVAKAQGITIIHLYGSDLKSLQTILPPNSEQKAIASVLIDADKEIAVYQSQRDALAREKAALMQQLLTGKRRVKVDKDEQTEVAT